MLLLAHQPKNFQRTNARCMTKMCTKMPPSCTLEKCCWLVCDAKSVRRTSCILTRETGQYEHKKAQLLQLWLDVTSGKSKSTEVCFPGYLCSLFLMFSMTRIQPARSMRYEPKRVTRGRLGNKLLEHVTSHSWKTVKFHQAVWPAIVACFDLNLQCCFSLERSHAFTHLALLDALSSPADKCPKSFTVSSLLGCSILALAVKHALQCSLNSILLSPQWHEVAHSGVKRVFNVPPT